MKLFRPERDLQTWKFEQEGCARTVSDSLAAPQHWMEGESSKRWFIAGKMNKSIKGWTDNNNQLIILLDLNASTSIDMDWD